MSIDALRGGKNPSRQKTNTRPQKEKKRFSFSPKRFFQKKNALFFSIPFFLLTFALSFFLFREEIKGATYGWVQESWSGGASSDTATHISNQTGWTKYESSSGLAASDTVSLIRESN